MIEIDKDIPIPPDSRGSAHYPWADMEIGDSFPVHISKCGGVSSSAHTWGVKQTPERKFTIRKISDIEYRVWRTK